MVAFSVSWLPHGAAATTIAERSAPRVAQFSATARRERLGRTTVGTRGMLASVLRTDPHCLRRLEATDPAIVELREWSRLSEDLTRERVRLANRMRQQLWHYPQFLDAVDDVVAAPCALDLWRNLPTPRAGQSRGDAHPGVEAASHPPNRRRDAACEAAGAGCQGSAGRSRSRRYYACADWSPNAVPWSTASSIARAARSTGWWVNSPKLLRRTTPTRPRRPRQSRRNSRPTRHPALGARHRHQGARRAACPRVATPYSGGTMKHFAVCAGWLRSPGVRARAWS